MNCGFNDKVLDLYGWSVEEDDEGLDVSKNHALESISSMDLMLG